VQLIVEFIQQYAMASYAFGGGSGRLSLPPAEPAVTDTGGVATFISKVWKILEKVEYNSLISWSDVSF